MGTGRRRGRSGWLAAALALALLVAAAWWWRSGSPPGPAESAGAAAPNATATFADEAMCAACHTEQADLWTASHHALAMQAPDKTTVLGDFADTAFTSFGLTTRFAERDGRFVVTTDGPDGRPAEYDVKYVFGVTPLQQYLLELPGGRLQALSVAWDTERKRWFHMYPNERIDQGDELHWTKPSQNWNFMCAECHSTDVQKNYDRQADRFDTQYFQINVGCQACHGPASAHLDWVAEHGGDAPTAAPATEKGFQVDLGATSTGQVEACARCHARRSVIAPRHEYGRRFMDHYRPSLLDEGLYYADGQIRDEVYEYGSFLQSKMFAKSLRCSTCHDPHSGARRAEGNALCATCHALGARLPDPSLGIDTSGLKSRNYDSPEHHFHQPGSPGSQCVACHAPKTTYMGVDPRADHSFRVPRPDLSDRTGAPDACTRCHTDRAPAWAAGVIASRAPGYAPTPHYGEALASGRLGRPGAVAALSSLVQDRSQPAIVRATALELLERYPGTLAGEARAAALDDPDPLVRRAAAAGFESASADERVVALAPLVTDPVRAVRIEAARLLAPVPAIALGGASRGAFEAALAELEQSHRANEDRAEGRLSLGNLFLDRGDLQRAEAEYESATRFDPIPVAALVNLADLYRATNREAQAEALLRRGLAAHPGNAALTHALVLSLVRQGRKPEALRLLEGVSAPTPDLAYLHAAALSDDGRIDQAIAVLERVLPSSNGDRNILLALAGFHEQGGRPNRRDEYLRQLAAINPTDPALPPGR